MNMRVQINGGGVAQSNGKKQVSIRQLVEWAFQREFAQIDFDSERRFGAEPAPSFGMEYLLLERARVGCSIDGGGRSEPRLSWPKPWPRILRLWIWWPRC